MIEERHCPKAIEELSKREIGVDTMKFKGKLWGLDFDATEADSPVELFQIIAPTEKDRGDVRGWVLVKSALRPYWLEIMLDDSTMFYIVSANDQLVLDEDSHVSVEFRRKPCNSPNTSPSKGDTGESVGESRTLSTLETFSSDAKDQSIDFCNSIDPFTRSSFAEIGTHLVLNFPSHDSVGVDAIFVDKESFEEYVQLSEKEGKTFDQLTLSDVELCDGSVQDLHLTWEIWVSSVLPASKVLRGCYHRVNVAEKVREGKLKCIKENESLWTRVTFWIDDFSDSEALERLEMVSDDPDVPPYMSPFYFRKEEAFLLSRLDGISSVSLGDVLRAKSSKSTCAAHDLRPFLEEVFRLDPGFHQVRDFRTKKEVWVTKRRQALQTNKPRVVKKAPPTFGAFGIR